MKQTYGVLLAALLMLLTTACGGGGPEEVEITINMSEFAYSPDTIELKVGQVVTINLVNDGTLEHEIMFGRNVNMVEDVASGFEMDFFEMTGVEPEGMMNMTMGDDMDMEHEDDHDDDHADEEMDHDMEDMDHDMEAMDEHAHSGYMTTVGTETTTATITFTVTEDMVGEWEFGCFLQEGTHYAAGMHGTLIVTE
ncbi:MAG: cupredoxin domain-containing protein [Anaerolineae bacterium]|nr:cupredoxin domain-containing protein [Anaerolineae bacterium]